MNTAVTHRPASLLLDVDVFNHLQRVGKVLALSPLFPDHLRKGGLESSIANGVLVMNMASRLNEDPLTVAQNIYFVGGKPGWSASYMIGKANQYGVFRDPIDWEVKGSGESLSVTAFAILKSTGKRVAVTCDMPMAKAEGWTSNKKYQSMPQQMLRYRSATFLIRLYCPEVMIGMPTAVELETTMKDVTPYDEMATIVGQAETVDADGVIREDSPAQEAKPEPVKAASPRAKREPAQADEKPTAEAVDQEQQPSMFDEEVEAKTPDYASDKWGAMFLKDVRDMGFDTAYDLHGAQVAEVKDQHPDFWSWLSAEATKIEGAE